MKKHILILVLVIITGASNAFGQFKIGGQLIQRGEYRNGYGKIISKNQPVAAHVGQRARITADYNLDSLHFHFSAQDIRVWGSAPQLKSSDGYLSVYEAYAETKLGKNVTIKLGRQELKYDNARFLGNVNWALQGRSHDFGLLKYERGKMKFHIGAGFNQNDTAGKQLSGTLYTDAKQYKMAQLIHYSNNSSLLSYALMFWNDGRQGVNGINFSPTVGIPNLKIKIGASSAVEAYYYHQLGKNQLGVKTNAFDVSVAVNHQLQLDKEKGKSITAKLGYELMSGTASGANENNTFMPLYGTNHAHNGHMDYFFVGGRNASQGLGLQDIYLKTKLNFSKKAFMGIDAHMFSTHQNVTMQKSKNLATELDVYAGYKYTQQVFLKLGYSQLFAQDAMEYLQGSVTNSKNTQNWAYAMVVYTPSKK